MPPHFAPSGSLLASNAMPGSGFMGSEHSDYGRNPIAESNAVMQTFWQGQSRAIEQGELDFKTFQLPLARIKKVMKTDEDVKMISSEAAPIFAKACEIFILEITLRAWIHTEECKRRTLQRADVAAAISRTDTFDFLIDIVPREESRATPKKLPMSYRGLMSDPAAAYYYGNHAGSAQPMAYHHPMPTPDMGMDSVVYNQQQQQHQHLQMLRNQLFQSGAIQDPGNPMQGGPSGIMSNYNLMPTNEPPSNGTHPS